MGGRLWMMAAVPALFLLAASGPVATRPALEVGQVRVATSQFPVSADIAANADWVRRQIVAAADQQADVVHFSECALSGYPGVDMDDLEGLDWALLHRETEGILSLAREKKVWVVLGSIHKLTGSHKPHNSLYVIDPEGAVVDRYDKRFCTSTDLKHFSPGDHLVTFEINGVRCGLSICYDVRFPELFRAYARRDVRLMFQSFHNARMKPDAIHPIIMPPSAQVRSASNYFFTSMNNSCVPHTWESLFITPDGRIRARLKQHEAGVMVNLVDIHAPYYDASAADRPAVLRGKLNSGQVVEDPRSRDRTCY